MITSITYEFWQDDAALFGPDPEGVENVDIPASYTSYMAAVEEAIQKDYPKADITVQFGPGNPEITCYDDNETEDKGHEEVPYIEKIIHEIWEAWDWVVEK